MARGRASHAVWRDLIAARLDRPLARSETRGLTAHLRDCAACRQVDHDYREQRALLHSLPQRPVPRDMWPRTSAALDREVARGSYRGGRPWRDGSFERGMPGATRRAAAPSAALVTTLAALGVIAALGVMQLIPTVEVARPTVPAQATAFPVAPQPLAFIGNEAADVYVYQTHVGHVCPPIAPDCQIEEIIVRTPVNLPASVHARNIALSPGGQTLAFVGRDNNRDMIAVMMLPPNAGDDPTDPGSLLVDSPTPGGSQPGTPTASGDPTGPAQTPADVRTPDSAATSAPTDTTPPASAVPGLRVVAILENVESAGAPPAWLPSGEMLAFSAMPADGSHGPDVYVWSPSDVMARPLTTDHGSYFASWSGERIVTSRVAAMPDAGEPQLSTVVIDPRTFEERGVVGPQLWLPVVNPAGTYAVAWRGDLDLSSGLAVPRTGALYMIEWAQVDPFAPWNEPVATPVASEDPTATPVPPSDIPAASPSASPTSAEPTAAATASATTSPAPTAAATAAATPSLAPTITPASMLDTANPSLTDPTAAPAVTQQPTPPLPAGAVALDLGRDTTAAPVVDWQVRWSLDGQVLGVWVADAEGSTWGRLMVLAVDPDTQQLSDAESLLSPTLASRGFSLGLSRVAWVAPSDDNPDGELRIRTWGDDGVGGLRLLPAQLEQVVPAF